MRKIIVLTILCALFLLLPACSAPCFESQEAMFSHLEGVWVVDDSQQSCYYFFFNGEVNQLEDWSFRYTMDTIMDSTIENEGVDALVDLEYEDVLKTLTTQIVLGDPFADVSIDHKKGVIVLNEGHASEKQIIADQTHIVVKETNSGEEKTLKRISPIIDFSGETFKKLFVEAKKNYTISAAEFWTNPKDYGAMVKAYNPEVDGWSLITSNEDIMTYAPNERVSNISGALIISKEEVTFTSKVSLLNTWNSNINWNPEFTVLYTPLKNRLVIIDKDNLVLDLPLLFQYGHNAIRKFPGAYDDYMDLYHEIASEEGKVSNGTLTVEKSINGITYQLQMATSRTWAMLTITAEDSVTIDEFVSYSKPKEVSYTTEIKAQVPIFEGPGYDYSFVQSVGQDGVYTIIAEEKDDEGNLWGKLKWGLGWINLTSKDNEPATEAPVSAYFMSESNLEEDCHQVIIDDSEYMVKVAFRANAKLTNVQFVSLGYDLDGFVVGEVLCTLPELLPEKPLVVGVSFPGAMSIYGISFIDSDGLVRNFAISTSGRNGSLVVEEYS